MWSFLKKTATSKPIQPPKVGGTRAPDQVQSIDFQQPHDFHFRFYNGGEKIYRSCLLIGFTTPVNNDGARIGGGNEWGGHDRWLVLRQADGRLAYVPREGLLYIEESQPDDSAPPS